MQVHMHVHMHVVMHLIYMLTNMDTMHMQLYILRISQTNKHYTHAHSLRLPCGFLAARFAADTKLVMLAEATAALFTLSPCTHNI